MKKRYKINLNDIREIESRHPFEELLRFKNLSQKRPSGYALKFSLPFGVAMALIRGKAGIDEFEEHNYKNKEALELGSRIEITGYESDEYPKHLPGWLLIKMKDGTVYEHRVKFERGCLENPIPEEEIRAKYHDNALRALPRDRVEQVEEMIDNLEDLDDISKLMKLCY